MTMTPYTSLVCDDEERRAEVANHATLNGIDYIKVAEDDQHRLRVYFIPKTTKQGQANLEKLLNALDGQCTKITIQGGVRVRDIRPTKVVWEKENEHLEVTVGDLGDFSTYTLAIHYPTLDPAYAEIEFSFKVDCPSPLDPRKQEACGAPVREAPLIDYLAKDYASFRQALLDLIAREVPGWQERTPADLGMALVELLAYTADQLSYYQDAVANEAYLETACQRVSVRRHARLIDYRMHDGMSARTFVHFEVSSRTPGKIPKGTQVLTRITQRLGDAPPGRLIDADLGREASELTDATFETMEDAQVHRKFNRISIYTWGNRRCCLPAGVTTLDLVGDLVWQDNREQDEAWGLKTGDLLLLEELRGATTGNAADADPTHRQVVRLTKIEKTNDPLKNVALTRVSWDWADRLTFPLCLSAQLPDENYVEEVSVARGNLVLADHGRRISEEFHPVNPDAPEVKGIDLGPRAYRFRLKEGPLSFRVPLPSEPVPVKTLERTDPHLVEPQVIEIRSGKGGDGWLDEWEPVVPHLLDSNPFDRHCVVETENDGRALLRFGKGEYGMAPVDGGFFRMDYRIGIGSAGNIGADALYHVVIEPKAARGWPRISAVRNPLPAWGGTDPESLEQVKRLAPAAFHAEPRRAVTEEDYAAAASKHPEVQQAMASFRWTGSWHTVFLTIDPVGTHKVSEALEERVQSWVQRYTQAGYDLEVTPPTYVALEIDAIVCVAADHFRSHVLEALLRALSNQVAPDGTRGFFHPDNFSFAEPLYLSRLYGAMAAVPGVDSVEVTKFKRLGKRYRDEKKRGYIPIERLEVLRLDNDPNFAEHGVMHLNMRGGK